LVLHTDFNQGIQILVGQHRITVQATLEKGRMRYWVGKPDDVEVEAVQCRTSTKAPLGARYPKV
jgi:hypothetical protein